MSIDLLQRALDYVRFYNPEKDQEIRAKLFEDLKAAIEQIHTSVSANTHQQPVAWAVELPDGTRRPLYAHPPVREWVGLTLDEINSFVHGSLNRQALCCAIEAKLKEKNNG